MDIQAMKASRSKMAATATKLAEKPSITPAEDAHLSTLLDSIEVLDGQIRSATEAIKSTITERAAGYDSPTYWKQTTRSEVFESDSYDVRTKADMAKRAAEVVEKDNSVEVRPEISSHVSKNAAYADYFRATSNPDYASAWSKVILSGSEASALLKMTDGERNAMARVAHAESRMNEGTPSAGGLAVPVAVDASSIVLNNSGSVTNIRNLARIVTAVSDTWQGLASTGVTASFAAEGAESGDNSPTLVGPTISAHRAQAFIPFSWELESDWQDGQMLTIMRELLADSKERLEADKFLTGSGSGEPFGLLTRLEANTAADVIVTTSGAIGAVDIYKIAADLPPRFRPNAAWLSSMTVLNEIRRVSDDKLGNYVTDLRAGYNFSLLGRPVYEASDMDAMVSTTAAATFAVFGDISRAYTVFDRLGSARISVVPHLFGSNNRPTGQSGIFYYFRTGGDVLSGGTTGEQGARILVNKVS